MIKEWSKGGFVKLAPGVKEFERRLGAPLYGLMNAHWQAFPKYGKEPLVPRWKTLVLQDSQGAWLGRVKYTRSTILQEHAEKLLSGWKKLWYQQLSTQV